MKKLEILRDQKSFKKKKYIEVVLAPEHGEFIYSQIVEISFGRTFVCFDQRTVRNFIRSRVRTRACVCVCMDAERWNGRGKIERERERETEKKEKGKEKGEKLIASKRRENIYEILARLASNRRLDIGDDKKVKRIVITEKCKFTVTLYSPDRASISK